MPQERRILGRRADRRGRRGVGRQEPVQVRAAHRPSARSRFGRAQLARRDPPTHGADGHVQLFRDLRGSEKGFGHDRGTITNNNRLEQYITYDKIAELGRPPATVATKARNISPSADAADSRIPRLAVSKVEAAEALGVSVDFLEEHVMHELRIVRRGRRRLIPIAELSRWMEANAHRTLGGE